MTTKIGSIVIDVDARIAKLEAAVAKADRRFKKFDDDIRREGARLERTFKSIGVAAATYLSFGGLEAAVKKVLDFADDIGTAAAQVNIGVERFQTLRGALRELEIPAEQADKVFQKLIIAMGGVTSGARDEATQALDKLGLSAKILSGEITTTDQLIDGIAKSFGDIKDPATKAALAGDLVGTRLGAQLASALGDGGKALHDSEARFRSAGKVIKSDYIDKLAEANEKWDRFVESVTQKGTIFAASTITAFESASHGVDKFFAKLIKNDPLGIATNAEKAWAEQFLKADSFKFQTELFDKLVQDKAKKGDKPDLLATKTDPFADLLSDDTAVRLDNYMRERAESMERANAAIERMGRPLEDITAKIDGKFKAAFEKWAETANESIRRVEAEAERFRHFVTDHIGTALEDLAFSGGRHIDDIAESFGRLAFEIAVIEPLMKRLRDLMSAVDTGGGLIGTIASAVGATFGGARAEGGPVQAGRTYLVGERGPEMFTPSVSGGILANDDIGGGGETVLRIIPSPLFQVEAETTAVRVVAATAPALVSAASGHTTRGLTRPALPGGIR